MLGDAQYDIHGNGFQAESAGSVESPDGQWRAEQSIDIRLVSNNRSMDKDGTEVTVDPLWLKWQHGNYLSMTGYQVPVWNPHITTFAIRAGWLGYDGLVVMGVDGTVKPVFEVGVALVVDWTEAGLSWVGQVPNSGY